MSVRKAKRLLIISILGLFFSIGVIFYVHKVGRNDSIGWYIIAAADICEIGMDIKRYRTAKQEALSEDNKEANNL